MGAYQNVLKPLLFRVDPERAHEWAAFGLRQVSKLGGAPKLSLRLQVSALGQTFPSPVGLAAGFDKDARVYRAFGRLGFGFVEVGTVTAEPQSGNPRPRLFRLPKDSSLINRMGFNNHGAKDAASRLTGPRPFPVGVNIGKTKKVPLEEAVADYETSTRLLGHLADYFVVNVSSPNTPGLRDLQAVEQLKPILVAVRAALDEKPRRVPLLVKIAPDLVDEDVVRVAELARELELDGIIATNTTIRRDGLRTALARVEEIGAGGLSGPPTRVRSLEVLKLLRKTVPRDMCVISVGGIESGEDVWDRLRLGANLVQVYTGFVYGGPKFVQRINRDLIERLDQAGLDSLSGLTANDDA